ncbi:translation initiation factor IF-2 [Candidatus Gracilibacteria bacterium]|nr:translation initiation factor IF-2 [Candidatus Gracilibacteria bacterium]
MPISVSDLAKKLDIAPEAVMLHAMDLEFEIPEDDMIPDEIAKEIRKIEQGDAISQTEHEIEEQHRSRDYGRTTKENCRTKRKKSFERKKDDEEEIEEEREEVQIVQADDGSIVLPEEMTVRELAVKISKPIPIVLIKLKQNGIITNLKENIDYETAAIIAQELNVNVKKEAAELSGEELFRGDLKSILADEETDQLQSRPPVISIMGHVDHGKTSILDYIRKEKVAAGEAGGITQRIGAYQVDVNGKEITFLDTPGHEAFTTMRARGAHATDIAILVVAANEGIKPQTIEAINHAKAAEIPIVVAINKMDMPGANPDLVKKGLAENDVNPEDWGGDTPCVPVSAHTGAGIDQLLDTVLTVAELLELKANPIRSAIGTVIESTMSPKSGITATVLINTGTLKRGDSFVIYDQHGKIRSMKNYKGEEIKVAPPSTPVQISGFTELPQMGDLLQVVKSDKIARKKAEEVASIRHEDDLSKRKKASLATLKAMIAAGKMKQLKVVIKADSNGTLEAVKTEVEKVKTEQSMAKVIHAGVGEISESDIMLAKSGGAILVGFNAVVPGRIENSQTEKESKSSTMMGSTTGPKNCLKSSKDERQKKAAKTLSENSKSKRYLHPTKRWRLLGEMLFLVWFAEKSDSDCSEEKPQKAKNSNHSELGKQNPSNLDKRSPMRSMKERSVVCESNTKNSPSNQAIDWNSSGSRNSIHITNTKNRGSQ